VVSYAARPKTVSKLKEFAIQDEKIRANPSKSVSSVLPYAMQMKDSPDLENSLLFCFQSLRQFCVVIFLNDKY
jgi:hypothetical protein